MIGLRGGPDCRLTQCSATAPHPALLVRPPSAWQAPAKIELASTSGISAVAKYRKSPAFPPSARALGHATRQAEGYQHAWRSRGDTLHQPIEYALQTHSLSSSILSRGPTRHSTSSKVRSAPEQAVEQKQTPRSLSRAPRTIQHDPEGSVDELALHGHQMPTRSRSSGFSSARSVVMMRPASSCVRPHSRSD